MRRLLSAILLSFITTIVFSQEQSLKVQALEEFKKEHYDKAISLMEQAAAETPDDAEIYYYLGWFNHYRAYDSRPLSGYDYSYSERIFKYLDKALELNPNYGDAKYFYGTECCANAFVAMQNYDSERLKYFYSLAYKKGAYPDWLIEFGKNFLMSCDENAILFTGGNMDFDISSYLQLCENFRTDITVIPIGNIDRPWYVSFLKNGLENSIRNITINLTEEQIMDIHPFKWRETTVFIDISEKDKIRFNLPEDTQMAWTIYPDLQSERMHSKIDGETVVKRSLLSPQRAILLQVIEDNFAERPIYFSNFTEPSFYGGLNDYFQYGGLVSKLTPFKTENTDYAIDMTKLEKLFSEENLLKYRNIKENDIPRISGSVMYGYGYALLQLANIYQEMNADNKIMKLIDIYTKHLKVDFNLEYEQRMLNELKIENEK